MTGELKLKQASAVLGVAPKDLQNLVQSRIIRPRRRAGIYYFDRTILVRAKVVSYVKGSLDTSTSFLRKFASALSALPNLESDQPQTVRFRATFFQNQPAVTILVPFAQLAAEVENRWPLAELAKDLPRGRKRPGWKREFVNALQQASEDLEGVSDAQILDAINRVRSRRSKPELAVVAESTDAPA